MSELKITFKLADKDIRYLRRVLRQAASAAGQRTPDEVIRAGRQMAIQVREAKPPQYVLDRVEKLETILSTVEDKDWAPPQSVRKKILTALAYFSNPADLIPDRIPGLGFLDDAIMIELISQDLRHEMHYYRQFASFRETAEQRPWTRSGKASLERRLVEKRKELRAKIQAAKSRDAERAESGSRGFFRW
ncbi:MAG: YkvA family protein [Myxococcota bacterium]